MKGFKTVFNRAKLTETVTEDGRYYSTKKFKSIEDFQAEYNRAVEIEVVRTAKGRTPMNISLI